MVVDPCQLSEIQCRLVETYQPKRLIVFGSQVWGTPDQDSDLDILIEIAESDEPVWKRPRRGYRALFGIGIPCDLLVRTTHEIEQERRSPTTLIAKIVNEGWLIFASVGAVLEPPLLCKQSEWL